MSEDPRSGRGSSVGALADVQLAGLVLGELAVRRHVGRETRLHTVERSVAQRGAPAVHEHLRQNECVADPNGPGLPYERPHRQTAVALTIDRSQHVKIALDPARLSARCHHAAR
jgi:hypothetical protein